MNKPQFIVIEGIDGSGKSTQADLLIEYFQAKGEKAVLSPEPSNGIIGNLIRQALKKRVFFTDNKQLFDEQMAYLFASDRHDHLYNDIDGVFKLIEDGFNVICTRYYFSSLAYNCHSPEQFDFVAKLNHKFPPPDTTIYLDLPVDISLERTQKRSLTEIYENKEKLTLVRANYHKILADYKHKIAIVDGTQNIETMHQQIIDSL